jgi:hypothetical protein
MNPRGQVSAEQPAAALSAIEGIYRSHLPEFRRAAAAITGDRELACDAVGSTKPVNLFVAFLPSSAGADLHGSSKTLEVIAHDAAGRELGRVRHDSLTNPSIRRGPVPEPPGR